MLQNMNNIQLKILSLLIFRRYYLRELALKMVEIPSTLQRNLLQFVKNGIIESIREGKNTYYYLPKKFPSRYAIKLAESYRTLSFIDSKPNLLALLNDILTNLLDAETIVIFGSYAKGLEKPSSDIDILVVGKKAPNLDFARIYPFEINFKYSPLIDPENNLIKEIIGNHIILKGGEFIYEQIFENLDR